MLVSCLFSFVEFRGAGGISIGNAMLVSCLFSFAEFRGAGGISISVAAATVVQLCLLQQHKKAVGCRRKSIPVT